MWLSHKRSIDLDKLISAGKKQDDIEDSDSSPRIKKWLELADKFFGADDGDTSAQ